MTTWQPYPRQPGSTVVGELLVLPGLYSPQLDNHRDLTVWLPPDYHASDRRYPVLYMHDAQNLFDKVASNSGDSEWEVDEAMTALSAEGLSAIIVGLPHMHEQRRIEYSPYVSTYLGEVWPGKGDAYLAFLIDTVKPLIDAEFRTLPGPATTGIAGSSMGGLISLYALLTRPDIFGLCGAFSTAYWFGDDGLLATTRERASGHGRVYLDVGSREGETLIYFGVQSPDLDAAYLEGVRALRDALLAGGYRDGDTLLYVEDEGAQHREAAWARRFPAAARFLLRP